MMIPRRPNAQPPAPMPYADLFLERVDPDGGLIYRFTVYDPTHLNRPMSGALIVFGGRLVHAQPAAPITKEIPSVMKESA